MKPPNLADMRDKMAAQRAQMEATREQGQLKVEALMLKAHREIYLRSGGRIGMSLLRVPSLLLTVTGRSTGKPQTVALVFATDGDDYVVTASNGGKLHNPDWIENLARHPSVEVQIGTVHSKATAEIIDRNDPRYERLWRLVNTNNHGRYYRYQHMTTRAIPIVRLRAAE